MAIAFDININIMFYIFSSYIILPYMFRYCICVLYEDVIQTWLLKSQGNINFIMSGYYLCYFQTINNHYGNYNFDSMI